MAARTLSTVNARRGAWSPAACRPAQSFPPPSSSGRAIRRPPQAGQARQPAQRTVYSSAAVRPAGRRVYQTPAAAPRPVERQPYRAPSAAPRSANRQPYRAPSAPRPRARRRPALVGAVQLVLLALCACCLAFTFSALVHMPGLLSGIVGMVQNAPADTGGIPLPADPMGAMTGDPMLDVQPVFQNPELPNGCEAASLAALLQYQGFSVSPADLAAGYLPMTEFSYSGPNRYGPDPDEAYAGDPFSAKNGWYCMEGPVIEAANGYLADQGSALTARKITGAGMDELLDQLRQGHPVAVWVTQGYEMPRFNDAFTWTLPNGDTYIPYGNLHCVVLTSMDETTCYLADPLQGSTSVSRSQFETVYTAMGSRAVVLE